MLKSWHTWIDYDNFWHKCYRQNIGNQNILYLPTSPHLYFCATWGNNLNRKPENCIFSLKCCMLFTTNTRNTLKYHLVTAEPPFTVKTNCEVHWWYFFKLERCWNNENVGHWHLLLWRLLIGGLTRTNCAQNDKRTRVVFVSVSLPIRFSDFITARRSYASAVLGVVILSVRLSVRLSVTRVLCAWLIQRTYRRYFYTTWKQSF